MKKSVTKTFLHTLEILAVVLSFLGRNSIARFLAAKLGLSAVVDRSATLTIREDLEIVGSPAAVHSHEIAARGLYGR